MSSFAACALSGRIAEIMARTPRTRSVAVVQQHILGGEFDQTRDMERVMKLLAKLVPLHQDEKQEQYVAESVSQVFSFLETHWGLVLLIAADLLGTYHPRTRTAKIFYSQLSSDTQKQLNQLRVQHRIQ